MKKALTLFMLALSLATFAQNATKVVVLDTYNRGGKLRQSTLVELKTDLAQTISETYGFEGVISDKVDARLLADGFAEHPRLSEEQAELVAKLSDAQYALMSSISCDNFGYLSIQAILIDLGAYQVMASESTSMNNTADQIHKGCEKLVKKIIEYLPKPEMPIVEEKPETVEQMAPTEPLPAPQQLTSLEAEKVSRLLNHADVCIEMNYIDEAIKKYDEIVSIAPGWANVYMYLGNTYASKGDAASLKKAKENYQKFMHLTDDQDLYYEAQDKLSRIEMMVELKGKEDENAENLVGSWKSVLHNKYTGQPWFIVEISKTAIPNKYQIILSPKSMMYENIVNTKGYSEVIDGKIYWNYTFQETYIPSQTKYNIAGATVNALFAGNSFGSTIGNLVGNVLVEGARANDVGYTNIMDFDFIADANIQKGDEYYSELCDMYMEGSCQMRGEHHQAGRNNVDMDTVRECDFLKGDGLFPVFEKVEKKGAYYFYGGDILTFKANLKTFFNSSPYISKEECERELKRENTATSICTVLSVISGVTAIGGAVLAYGDINNKQLGVPLLALGSVGTIVSFASLISASVRFDKFQKSCFEKHNKQVDENIRKYGRRNQASASVSVGLTPTGVGVSLNF